MAKRTASKPKPKQNLDDTLPPDVEYVTVRVPVYTGPLDRPRCYRIEARFDTKEESDIVQRMYHAMTLLLQDSHYPISMNLTFRSLLKSIAAKIS